MTRKKITGTVTYVDKGSDENSLGIDDEKYEMSVSLHQSYKNMIDVSIFGDFYLDYFGRIAACEKQQSDWTYGYLLKSANVGTFDEEYAFKIFTEDGEMKIINAHTKLYIDGTLLPDGTSADSRLSNGQLIRYKTNKNGLLTKIDSSQTVEEANSLTNYYSGSNIKYIDGSFMGNGWPDDAVKVFVVPTDTADEED